MFREKLTPDLTFDRAADLWLQSRSAETTMHGAVSARYIRENTEDSYRQYIRTLTLFFTGMKLGKIDFTHFADYQKTRISGSDPFIRYRRPHDEFPRTIGGIIVPPKGKTPCPASPKKCNQELSLLKRVLILAGCWSEEFEELYEPWLVEEADTPRALTPGEQQHWLRVAETKPEWNLIHWYSLVAFDTCMSTDELRGLRLGDINLQQKVLTVPRRSSKNKHRNRTIELVGFEVLWALEQLLARAAEAGAVQHHHYLFPFRQGIGYFEPDKPMTVSGLKYRWQEVREASKLLWFRPYDTRHTAITRMAERGIPVAVIKSFAGHISQRMSDYYTHISQSAQRGWREFTPTSSYPGHGHRPVPRQSPTVDVALERVTQTPQQTQPASVTLAPQRQSDSPVPLRFASAFYVTSSTW